MKEQLLDNRSQGSFEQCSHPPRMPDEFRIGLAGLVVSLLLAAPLSRLLLLLFPVLVGEAVVIIVLGLLWFGLFFFSLRWQRRYALSLDQR